MDSALTALHSSNNRCTVSYDVDWIRCIVHNNSFSLIASGSWVSTSWCPALRYSLIYRPLALIQLEMRWPFRCSGTIAWTMSLVYCQMVVSRQTCALNNSCSQCENHHYRQRPFDGRQREIVQWKTVAPIGQSLDLVLW